MPEISRFYGIVVKMFFDDHEPSHIHAIYGEYVGVFNIKTREMIKGDLPADARSLVKKWMKKHTAELAEMWDSQKIKKLPPLA